MKVKIIRPYFDSKTKELIPQDTIKTVEVEMGNLLIGRGFAEEVAEVAKKKIKKKAV